MAAFGAGLLDDPLGASDWDTDSLLAGADCAGASVGAPQTEQSQSAVDVNAMDMDAGSAGALAGAWGVAPSASAPLGPLNAPLPMSIAPPMGWSQHGTGDNVNHLPMPTDPSVFMGEAGLFHQLSSDMLDRAGVPSEVTLGVDGELHVGKELVCCHMPPSLPRTLSMLTPRRDQTDRGQTDRRVQLSLAI